MKEENVGVVCWEEREAMGPPIQWKFEQEEMWNW